MAAHRSYIPPRWRDEYSFSGRGRLLVQYTYVHPTTGQLEAEGPPVQPQPVPVRG